MKPNGATQHLKLNLPKEMVERLLTVIKSQVVLNAATEDDLVLSIFICVIVFSGVLTIISYVQLCTCYLLYLLHCSNYLINTVLTYW